MRLIFHFTKDGALLGPGTMFLLASFLYGIATYCACELPVSPKVPWYVFVLLFILLYFTVDMMHRTMWTP
jgi:hypothetical protein